MTEIKRGDVFLVDLPDLHNHIQAGLRPCVVVQNNMGNTYSSLVIICPITTKAKNGLITHAEIKELSQPSVILCEQIMTIDKSQLKHYITSLGPKSKQLLTLSLTASILMD